jgi:hypothetical protein
MDNTIPAFRPDVVALETAPRPTATPARVQFSDVLSGGARALMQGAQAAVRALPGAPVFAAAVRGGGLALSSAPGASSIGSTVGVTPEGPSARGAGPAMAPLVGTGGSAGADGIEGSLAQSQQMNLYYLQVQEQVNSENRTFTLLSNVLEVEHNTAKSAIGNIH